MLKETAEKKSTSVKAAKQPAVRQSTVQRQKTSSGGSRGFLESLLGGSGSKSRKDTPLDRFMKSAASSIGTQVGRSVIRGILGSISK